MSNWHFSRILIPRFFLLIIDNWQNPMNSPLGWSFRTKTRDFLDGIPWVVPNSCGHHQWRINDYFHGCIMGIHGIYMDYRWWSLWWSLIIHHYPMRWWTIPLILIIPFINLSGWIEVSGYGCNIGLGLIFILFQIHKYRENKPSPSHHHR